MNDRPSPLWRDHRLHPGFNLYQIVESQGTYDRLFSSSSKGLWFKVQGTQSKNCHWYSRASEDLIWIIRFAESSSESFPQKRSFVYAAAKQEIPSELRVATQSTSVQGIIHTDQFADSNEGRSTKMLARHYCRKDSSNKPLLDSTLEKRQGRSRILSKVKTLNE